MEEYNAEVMVELNSAPFWLGFDDGPGGMDESSDGEGPETALRRENEQLRRDMADVHIFIAAVQELRAHEAMGTELERARMQLEDHPSFMSLNPWLHGIAHLSLLSIHNDVGNQC